MSQTALITGASSGIGASMAEILAQAGFNLVLVARRQEALHALKATLTHVYNINVWVCAEDLSVDNAAERIVTFCQSHELTISVLVNNAGYGHNESFHALSWRQHQDFLHVLLVAAIQLTYLLLPEMIKQQHGRIINIASIVGLMPGGGMYAASKAALIKFSQGIHQDYKSLGIYSCAVCPGLTHSEFHNNMPAVRKTVPAWLWMSSNTVAKQAWSAVEKGKTTMINGYRNKFFVFISTFFSNAFINRLYRRVKKV